MRKPSASARRPRPRDRAAGGVRAKTAPERRRAPGGQGEGGRPTAPVRRAPARTTRRCRDAAASSGARRRRSSQGGKIAPVADTDTGTSRGKYVYCIIEAADPLRFGPIGIGADPSDVYTVHYKNLAAVVSDAPLEVLDSTRENVLAHERVNETVMREHTVIPMSFGTIFKTREDIVELLRSAADAFGDVLNKMQNKLEFGLKVLWDRDQAIREVESGGRGHRPAEEGDLGPEGTDLLRPHAVRPAGRRGAAGAVRALRGRHPRPAARRVGRVAHQQADRRQDDHERRVPDLARRGSGVRRAR